MLMLVLLITVNALIFPRDVYRAVYPAALRPDEDCFYNWNQNSWVEGGGESDIFFETQLRLAWY
jgi:hypothetical protein